MIAYLSYQSLTAYQRTHLIQAWQYKPLILQGRIDSLLKPLSHGGLQLDVKALKWCDFYHDQCIANPGRIRLTWYGHHSTVHAGEQWQWKVKLKEPRGYRDPGVFDYARWLKWQGFVATGYVLDSGSAQLIKAYPWQGSFLRMRENLSTFISKTVSNSQRAGILKALATGDRSQITPSVWELFKNTGTNHLLAISGLHIGLVAGWGYAISGQITRWFPMLCHTLPRPLWQSMGGLLAAFYYSALAGGAISTQRALAMALIPVITLFQGRSVSWLRQCIWLMILFGLLSPSSLMSPAFYLSFGAVIWIFYSLWGQWGNNKLFYQWLVTQGLLTFGLLPLTLWFFQGGSLTSVLANALAIPWFTFLIVPFVLSASILFLINPIFSSLLLKLASYLLIPCLYFLNYLKVIPPWFHSVNHSWLVISAMVGVVIVGLPQGIGYRRLIGLLWFLPLLFWPYPKPGVGEWWFTLLDVGQGLATVIHTPNHVLIYDTGPAFANGVNAGERVLTPYLNYFGIQKIDTVIVSHGDRDHSGGLSALQKHFTINQLIVGEKNHPELKKGTYCHAGESWTWEGLHFQFLYPWPNSIKNTPNAHSCVLRISDGKNSILLPGDIGTQQEKQIRQGWQASDLASTILIAAHHGSCHANSFSFLKKVNPQLVLFSYSFHNAFHFPCKRVIRYLTQRHIAFTSTADKGAIILHFKQEKTLTSETIGLIAT